MRAFGVLARSLSAAVALSACGASVPASVKEEMSRSPRGTATVVFFTDFQCPHCRRTHAMLAPMIEERGGPGRVRVVLRHVPLRSHPDAWPAAQAAVCAEKIGAPEVAAAYAHALFTAPGLGDEELRASAEEAGLAAEPFASCLRDPGTDARIEQDRAAFVDAGGDGVPLLYVGTTRIDGAPTREALAAALDDALARAAR